VRPDSLIQDELCADASIEINGVFYDINNPSGDVAIVTPEGCEQTIMVRIDFADQVTSFLDTLVCEDATVVVDGRTFDMNNPTGDIMFPNGSVNGCDSILSVSLEFIQSEEVQVPVSLCPGEVRMILGIAVTEDLSPDDLFFIGPNLCDTVLSFDVSAGEIFSIDLDTLICSGEAVELFGITFDENNPAEDIRLQSGNGCDSIISVSVDFIIADEVQVPVSLCPGETQFLFGIKVTEDFTLDDVFSVGPNGCDTILSFDVSLGEIFSLEIDAVICPGQSLDFFGVTFDENNLSDDILLTSPDGCDSTIHVSLEVLETYNVDFEQSLCEGESMVINNTTYDENNPTGIENLVASNGCDSVVNINLLFGNLSAEVEIVNACPNVDNGQITISGLNGNIPYLASYGGMDTIFTNSSLQIDDLTPDDYDIIIEDATGCAYQNTITVMRVADFNLSINSIDNGDGSLNLDVLSDVSIVSATWQPPIGLTCTSCTNPVASVTQDQQYVVTVFDENGCSDILTFTVFVGAEEPSSFYLPNAFNPNSIGNDRFYLQSEAGLVISYSMQIFNRWGEKVFEIQNAPPDNNAFGWDGRRNGQQLNPGVFIYRIAMTTDRGTEVIETGDVLLMR